MVASRFEVYLVRLDPTEGREIQKTRPGLVVSPDEMNRHLGTVMVAPTTTKGRAYPTRVPVQFVGYTSGPLHSFAASQDLLGDGSVVLLPTPGHGPGHQCVLVRMDGYELLITGDILYTLRHLAVDQVRALQFGGTLERQQVESIRRIQSLWRALSDLVLVTGHDHSAYQFQHLVPFLADGVLSAEERQAIKAYETTVFDAHNNLMPEARPRFVHPTDHGHVGTVVEPRMTGAAEAF